MTLCWHSGYCCCAEHSPKVVLPIAAGGGCVDHESFETSVDICRFSAFDPNRVFPSVVVENCAVCICLNQFDGDFKVEVFLAGDLVLGHAQLNRGGVRETGCVKDCLLTRARRGKKKKTKHYWKDIHIPIPAALAS